MSSAHNSSAVLAPLTPAAGQVVGIDVAKEALDLAFGSRGELDRIANAIADVLTLRDRLLAAPPQLVVLEATGGYEALVADTLAAAGLPVAVVNPRQVRAFARSRGYLEKTDRLDARVLAGFGEANQPMPRPRTDAATRELAGRVTRRHQLVVMRTAEQQRARPLPASLAAGVDRHLAWLRQEIATLDREIAALIAAHPQWAAQDARLRTVPGVGAVVSATLLGALPELGQLGPKPLAKLVGVAPLAQDSGKQRGKRRVGGGRGPVRTVLYLAAVSGARHNPVLRPYYERLRAKGKAPKVALTACMHKLLTILNAMVRDGASWHPPGA